MIISWFIWQFWEAPKTIVRAWANLLVFNLRFFSIDRLRQTLFSPWRGLKLAHPKDFDPLKTVEVLFSNLIFRTLGAFARLAIIAFGLANEIIIFFAGLALLIGWLLLPFFVLAAGLLAPQLLAAEGILGPVILFLALVATLWQAKTFKGVFESRDPFSPKARRALEKAVDADSLFQELLNQNDEGVGFVLTRLLLQQKLIRETLAKVLSVKEKRRDEAVLQKIVAEARKFKTKSGRQRIESGDLLSILARESHLFQNILEAAGLKAEDVDNLVWWFEKAKEKARENQAFWEPKNLAKKGALGRGLSSGFTPLLDQFGLDWALILSQKQFEEIVGHQSEIEQIERILVKSQFANCLIVGDPGSGRGAVLQALTQKILFGESLAELNYQRVMELDLPRLTASLKTLPEIDNALQIIFQEAVSAGNVVLVVQDLHNFVGLAGSLSNFLKYPGLKLVAVTDYHGLHRQIEPSQLMNFFEKVEVEPLSAPETTRLLEWLVPSYETKYKKFISYLALKELVNKSEKYLPALPFPKKAVDLLEELMIFVSKNQETTVLASHVDQLISQKTQIPVGQIDFKEREILLNLEALLHERIINQEEAVREAASALRRARSGVATKKGTIGNFLFLGPTGVGKTETAKALAQIYFGSEDKIIRLDLSEYQNPEDLRRLLGSAQEESYFVTAVRENPFSLVLLDEIEKAHSQVHNLFLQILDEGAMRDGLGRKINFNHCLLIATSNAGYQVILEAIEQKQEMPAIKDKLIKYVFDQGIFRPEFLNRFDALVVFRSLTKENLLAIAELLLSKLKKNLKDKNVELVITPELKEKIVELGYDPIFGARQMKRVIQDRVENIIASALLAGQIKRGDKIEIEVPDFKLIVA